MASETTALVKGHQVAYADADSNGSQVNEETSQDTSGKSIGYLGSIAIGVNAMTGPAILQLPFQFQESGLIPTTICLIIVAVLSALCSAHTANVVSQVPGNKNFYKPVEFSDPFKMFWGPKAFKATQIMFYLCVVCLNVAAIVDTAQVVDSILGFHGGTYGYDFEHMQFHAWSHGPCKRRQVKEGQCDPFPDVSIHGNVLLTLGYIITTAVFLPFCLMDLKENKHCQVFGFTLLMATAIYFSYRFHEISSYGTDNVWKFSLKHVSLWGDDWKGMLGIILFNFSLVLAIPAWLHEKKEHVCVNRVVRGSTILAAILYIFVGSLGASAIPHVNVNMLSPMVSGAFGPGIQIAGSIFAFFIIGLDIPLFCVLARYNLTHSGLCTKRTANLLVVWLPWLVSWIFYQGDTIKSLLDWGGVLLTSAVAFILPLYLALRVLRTTGRQGSIHVYGVDLSVDKQITLLNWLLLIVSIAVILAIAGQIASQTNVDNYIHSESYLNGTSVLPYPLTQMLYNNKPPI